jgi:NAD(P)-dependent dehydrogenase (short-subunit alcohol dehydrogenase family)
MCIVKIAGSVVLVTGANRGMGRHYVEQLLERGAAKVYATARRTESVDLPGAEVLALDVTDPESVRAAAAAAPDVTFVVNNAGISTGHNLITGDLAVIRRELETNFFGPLTVVREFAPVLAANGGGAVLNMLSALSWFSSDGANSYSVAKAAEWSMTNGIRLELIGQGTYVAGVHIGLVDTDMAAGLDLPKSAPADIVRIALDGIEAGLIEIVADDWSAHVKASLSADPALFYPQTVPAA